MPNQQLKYKIMSTGKSLAHDSAVEHVTGSARYVDDLEAVGDQLYVAVGFAPLAHGTVSEIQLDRVRSAWGVVDVIVHSDLPAATDIGPVFPGDALLSAGLVEFYGQPLFAVAATSHQAAVRAVTLADYVLQESAPVLDVTEADEADFHVRPSYVMKRGDSAAALSNSNHRLKNVMNVGGQEHFYLEGQVARAFPEEHGGVTVLSSNQNPTEAQHIVAKVLNIPMHKVTLETRRMGGGFGGKETQANACCALAAVFAVRLQRAVSFRLSRRDDMVMTGKRHGFVNHYDVGFSDDGVITGIDYRLIGQCGNSPDLSDAIVDRAMFHCDNAYYLPHVTVEGVRAKTHTVSNTAFRGFGGPQGMIAAETVMDDIACAVGADPLDIRKRNFYGKNERNVTHYGQTVNTFTVPQLVEQLEVSSDYRARRKHIQAFNAEQPVLRRGIALTPVKFGISFTVKHLNQGGALIHLYSDGSVQLNHGGTEMGQGLMVKVQQIVGRTLGMNLERIAVMATRTDKVPNTSATAASSGTDINGMAAMHAALRLKRRLVKFLTEKYAVAEADIEFNDDSIQIQQANESLTIGWSELAREAYLARVSLSATGFYKTPDIHFDRDQGSGRPFYYFANGAACTEVLIDTLTGETRILRADILHDVGRSINPAIDIGQIEGAFVQGVGWLTHEEIKWDEHGRLLTDGPATYKIPAISDAPDIFKVDLLENSPNEEATVFRSKAVGEPPLMLAISAYCAIRDAIASLGKQSVFPKLNAPATPEEVLRCCDQVRQDYDELA